MSTTADRRTFDLGEAASDIFQSVLRVGESYAKDKLAGKMGLSGQNATAQYPVAQGPAYGQSLYSVGPSGGGDNGSLIIYAGIGLAVLAAIMLIGR